MEFILDEAFLPAILTAPPMTDEQFAQFCSDHPDLFFEMSAEGELIVMPPQLHTEFRPSSGDSPRNWTGGRN